MGAFGEGGAPSRALIANSGVAIRSGWLARCRLGVRALSNGFDTDVLIVGAGPAGLVLACELARRGVAFRLVEQRGEPLRASRGKGVQPRTQEIFEDLGVLEAFQAVSGPYPPLRLMEGENVLGERPFNEQVEATEDIPYPNMMMSPQWRTDAVLRERLGELGGHVEYGTALGAFVQDEAAVTAELDVAGALRSVRSRYLVGTDGGRSSVRAALDLAFPGETMDQPRMLFGDVTIEGLSRDAWWMWPSAAGNVGLCPLPHVETFQLMITLAPGEEPELSEPAVASLFESRTGRTDLGLRDPSWLSIFTPSLRLAEAYQRGRVFIAGDAAHVHPPTGAQGLNTSVQDAYNLGWKLALVLQGVASDALLATYESERRPIAEAVLDISSAIARQQGGVGSQPRGRQTQQLDISYRSSVLSLHSGRPDRALVAGDRAPDAIYVDHEGRRRRLFEAFRGPHFTLLTFGAVDAPASSEGPQMEVVRLPTDGQAALTYGISGPSIVLVRPDNYIGLIDESPAPTTVSDYLSAALQA
ncbi:MAG: FAD-binding monooxygenase, PheA/TfdB family [Phenylobacterium sp.]|nr:FAD-binding monooxygenase, PheA/TfdB family [Phenylobacterium sp.]